MNAAGHESGEFQPADDIHVVVQADCAGLDELTRFSRSDPVEDPSGFWADARAAADHLPDALAPPLPGGLRILRGLRTDPDAPPTPRDSRRPPGRHVLLSEFWLSVFGLALGRPVAFAGQQAGALIQNVSPIPGRQSDESDVGSSLPLPFHTENPFHALAPDFLLLVCVRADESSLAATTLAQVSDLVSRLDSSVIAALREPIFAERGTADPPQPVLSGPQDDPWIRFDASWTEAVNEAGADALAAVLAALPICSRAVRLAAGDLIVIDNRRWLHGRTRFNASAAMLTDGSSACTFASSSRSSKRWWRKEPW